MPDLFSALLAVARTGVGKVALGLLVLAITFLLIRMDAKDDFANEIRTNAYRSHEEHGRKVDDIIQEVEDADSAALRDWLRRLGNSGEVE